LQTFKSIFPHSFKKNALQAKSDLLFLYRLATWRNRILPDFIIIGAQKSGTSSLYYYLGQHPQIIRSLIKEIHYFDGGLNPKVDNFKRGQAWYRAHFPLKVEISSNKKSFEASPSYIFNPLAPERIASLVPRIKLIAFLRNPTDRAISHYFHAKRRGYEHLPVMEALQVEDVRLKPFIEKKDYKSDIFRHHSYKNRGLYYEQIKRYLKYFQKENILIINSDKLFSEPDNTLKQVFNFIEIDPEFAINDLSPRNVANNRSEVTPDIYHYLDDYFRSHNELLYELIGENFEW